ncbi:class I SAM-dependent methyltransferase [Lysobacter silvisoli]|uniref:Class I SAM-dependent methyltransferase n=1 Tax=Lysobacter silvisoli TaxID=2293254 RepID=A0A371JZD8_9GAMM|nr:class I SAM-dependent methyltransferase [Lysobacter silvisoli]RDZ27026.1 class I SAM-dependent methyltransferase [Lysobacter silvisoli]
MRIGPVLRACMPARLERAAANAYRAIFVDLDRVADALAGALPADASVLDIGGGDGELLNRLFARRPDLRVTMVDVAASVGRFLRPDAAERVTRIPATTIQDHLSGLSRKYDAAIVVDVMHHVALDQREDFLRAVMDALRPSAPLLIKDVEPGHYRATLGYLADKYISGDRGVVLVASAQLAELLRRVSPDTDATEIGLLARDRPNYLMRVSVP